jgi:hypothetical protein
MRQNNESGGISRARSYVLAADAAGRDDRAPPESQAFAGKYPQAGIGVVG